MGENLSVIFDVVPVGIVELAAQFVACESSRVTASIDEKLRVGDIVFLRESVEKRGSDPAAVVNIEASVLLDQRNQPN